jgi:formylglycine-generating enzyme required for sulfatase activity
MVHRSWSNLACLAIVLACAGPLLAQPQSLSISGLRQFYSSPYLLDPANPFTALPCATLGKLVRFQLQGRTNLTQCFYDLSVVNSLYQQTGAPTFVIDNARTVSSPLTVLPRGTPVAWLAQYGITNNLIEAELADPDGDGVPTWQEYLTGTNPTSRNSAFLLTRIQLGNGCQITCNTELDWLYRVEYADVLNQWQTLQAGIIGTGNPTNMVDAQAARTAPARYYRIVGTYNPWQPDINKFAYIPPGTFTLGSRTSEPDRYDNEVPHPVTISKGFWMGKKEVTQAEYRAVIGSNPSSFTGDLQLPVEDVSWFDATNYCGTLTQQERASGRLPSRYEYRLPTEAQWEYACRASNQGMFCYGDDSDYSDLAQYAWYTINSGNQTHPVGTKQPNAWGLYDMHGNVWEWCLDWYGDYPTGSTTNPAGPRTGSYRVFRGGGWDYYGQYCRSASRDGGSPSSRANILGFRVTLVQVP